MTKDEIKTADRATVQNRLAEITPTLTDPQTGKVSGEVFAEIKALKEREASIKAEEHRAALVADAERAKKREDEERLLMSRPEVRALASKL